MRKFSDLSEREGGFTLIELLVVIIIIGILAAIAIPLFLDQRKLAVDAQTKSDVRGSVDNIVTAVAVAGPGNAATATLAQSSGTVLVVKTAAAGASTGTAQTQTAGQVTVPANNDLFSVAGYNTGGKVYTSATGVATGTNTGPFTYTASTGQFAQATS